MFSLHNGLPSLQGHILATKGATDVILAWVASLILSLPVASASDAPTAVLAATRSQLWGAVHIGTVATTAYSYRPLATTSVLLTDRPTIYPKYTIQGPSLPPQP
jgi:hypothetical protein